MAAKTKWKPKISARADDRDLDTKHAVLANKPHGERIFRSFYYAETFLNYSDIGTFDGNSPRRLIVTNFIRVLVFSEGFIQKITIDRESKSINASDGHASLRVFGLYISKEGKGEYFVHLI